MGCGGSKQENLPPAARVSTEAASATPAARIPLKLASKLDVSKSAHLKEAFASFSAADKDASGKLDAEEFAKHFGLHCDIYVQRLMILFDRDGNGQINFEEFIRGMAVFGGKKPHAAKGDKQLKLAFKLLDLDGDGGIGKEELWKAIRAGEDLWARTTAQELQEAQSWHDTTSEDDPIAKYQPILFTLDKRKPCRIEYDEFVMIVEKYPRMAAPANLIWNRLAQYAQPSYESVMALQEAGDPAFSGPGGSARRVGAAKGDSINISHPTGAGRPNSLRRDDDSNGSGRRGAWDAGREGEYGDGGAGAGGLRRGDSRASSKGSGRRVGPYGPDGDEGSPMGPGGLRRDDSRASSKGGGGAGAGRMGKLVRTISGKGKSFSGTASSQVAVGRMRSAAGGAKRSAASFGRSLSKKFGIADDDDGGGYGGGGGGYDHGMLGGGGGGGYGGGGGGGGGGGAALGQGSSDMAMMNMLMNAPSNNNRGGFKAAAHATMAVGTAGGGFVGALGAAQQQGLMGQPNHLPANHGIGFAQAAY